MRSDTEPPSLEWLTNLQLHRVYKQFRFRSFIASFCVAFRHRLVSYIYLLSNFGCGTKMAAFPTLSHCLRLSRWLLRRCSVFTFVWFDCLIVHFVSQFFGFGLWQCACEVFVLMSNVGVSELAVLVLLALRVVAVIEVCPRVLWHSVAFRSQFGYFRVGTSVHRLCRYIVVAVLCLSIVSDRMGWIVGRREYLSVSVPVRI